MDFTPTTDIHNNPRDPRPIAVEGVLRVGDLCIVTGSWDTFKSTFALELAWSLATRVDFLRKFRVSNQVRMGIVQAEIDPGSYDHRLLVYPPTQELLAASLIGNGSRPFTFDRLDELQHDMEEFGMGGIVLDPIGQMWPRNREFNPNWSYQVSPILWDLKTMGKTVILVHHDPKPGQGVQNWAAGAAALLNDPDVRIHLDRKGTSDDVTVTIRNRLQEATPPFLARFHQGRLRSVVDKEQT